MQRCDIDRLASFGHLQSKKYPHSFLTLVREVLFGGKLPCSRAWRSSCQCWSPQAWSSRRGPWACAPSCQVVGRRTTTASWWAAQPCRSTTSSSGAPRLRIVGGQTSFSRKHHIWPSAHCIGQISCVWLKVCMKEGLAWVEDAIITAASKFMLNRFFFGASRICLELTALPPPS